MKKWSIKGVDSQNSLSFHNETWLLLVSENASTMNYILVSFPFIRIFWSSSFKAILRRDFVTVTLKMNSSGNHVAQAFFYASIDSIYFSKNSCKAHNC